MATPRFSVATFVFTLAAFPVALRVCEGGLIFWKPWRKETQTPRAQTKPQPFQQLDDGWPESVEEQSLLLLVWKHYITRQYIKDVL